MNCSAELETPFCVINEFKHKYVLVTLKERNEKVMLTTTQLNPF